jgi:periplasmic protein TonB
MTTNDTIPLPEVYSTDEIAQAAGTSMAEVAALVAAGEVRSVNGRYFVAAQAVHAVRCLRDQTSGTAQRSLFRQVAGARRDPALPIVGSAVLHSLMLASMFIVTSVGLAKPLALVTPEDRKEMRLVFLATPGPGGGGGGGGRKEPAPAPAALRKGVAALRSPLPIRRPPPPIEPPHMVRVSVPPPPVKAEPLPQIVAPVVPIAADTRDRVGVPIAPATSAQVESHGPGTGGGAGTGRGTGLGEGDGAGIGPGSGGGTGGGPYRPGSGIAPPTILREVKPDYTEEGRRRNVEGDVVLEIVVRRDGTVGDIKVLHGLGAGLDQRAVEAVRQWRFSPARRQTVAVDVVVEVAVEFKLR